MESNRNSYFKVIKRTLRFLITNMLIGLTIASIIDYTFWYSLESIIKNVIYSMVIGTFLWKGNEIIFTKLSSKHPWIKKPARTLIWGILLTTIYSCIIFIALNYVWLIFILNNNIEAFYWFCVEVTPYIIASILFVSLVSHSIVFYKDWKKTIINEEKLKRERLALQYETFKNQISPHFLFNSLNVLTSLIYIDPDKAYSFIDELSKVYSYVLNLKEKDIVRLHEEAAFLESYIFLQKIRFGASLNVDLQLEIKEEEMIIPLSIQMLVENAIKHNIVSENKPLEIHIYNENGNVVVKNKLQRRFAVNSSKTGLENISHRYEMLTNKKISVDQNEGFFTVKLPILKEL